MTKQKQSLFSVITVFVSLLLVTISVFVVSTFFLSQKEHANCSVESIRVSEDIIVYTDCGDFTLQPIPIRDVTPEDVDSVLQTLRYDREFTITTIGYRLSPFSTYPAIIDIR